MSEAKKQLRVAAIVPMRHFSQRVAGKNYRLLAGKPLFHYIIETLLSVPEIHEIVIDTDSPVIIEQCKQLFPTVRLLQRPAHLVAPETPMNDVLLNIVKQVKADLYLQTHSTNPLLPAETISAAIKQLTAVYPQRDSLFSVKRHQTRLWNQLVQPINHNEKILLQTQDLPPVYEENSCIYIFSRENLEIFHNRIGARPLMFIMTNKESVDIDTEWEWSIADSMLSARFAASQGEKKKELFKLTPVADANAYAKKFTVLISAPYMIMNLTRFRPILESFGLELLVPEVHERLNEPDIFKIAGQFDGGICGDDKWSPAAIKACAPRLKCLSKWGTGIDSFDQPAAEANGVKITRTPDAFSVPVSESCLAYMLAFSRKGPWMSRAMHDDVNEWKKIPGFTLSECTIGVIGVGAVGKAVIRRAKPFARRIVGYDVAKIDESFIAETGTEMVSLDRLLAESDFVSVNCDLTPTSFHLINADTLRKMKKTAYLINTARGPIVDEVALVDALEKGIIAGAALDVFENEPLPASSPLRRMDNVMLASHNSNSSPLYWEYVHWNTIKNLLNVLGVPYNEEKQ